MSDICLIDIIYKQINKTYILRKHQFIVVFVVLLTHTYQQTYTQNYNSNIYLIPSRTKVYIYLMSCKITHINQHHDHTGQIHRNTNTYTHLHTHTHTNTPLNTPWHKHRPKHTQTQAKSDKRQFYVKHLLCK